MRSWQIIDAGFSENHVKYSDVRTNLPLMEEFVELLTKKWASRYTWRIVYGWLPAGAGEAAWYATQSGKRFTTVESLEEATG